MNIANVNLSENERMLVTNTEWILTKHQVIKKVYDLFGALSDEHKNYVIALKDKIPLEVAAVTPKIYKGEQYLQLPYVMMDYPRYYKVEDAFALRHFFWWGNFFSIALHLSGLYKKKYEEIFIKWYDFLAKDEWFACIHNEPWHHHFLNTNYLQVNSFSEEEWNIYIKAHTFIKIAKKIPLTKWENAYEFFTENFIFLMNITV